MKTALKQFFILLAITLLATAAVQAQDATVTIDPVSGDPGTAFTITVTGLQANTTYTTDFILESSGETLFTTNRTANNTGELILNISSSGSDPEGVYLVQVSDSNGIVADGQFTLGAATAPEQTQPTPPPAGNSRVTLRVNPDTAETGATYDIIASGLENDQTVRVQIADPTGTVVYNNPQTADAGGQLTVEIFTTDSDPAGTYTVSLLDNAGVVLAGSSFDVTSPEGRDAVVTVNPAQGNATATYNITVTDLKPFADLLVEVLDGDSETVFSRRIRADVNGAIDITFEGDESLTAGAYQVIVEEGDVQVGAGEFLVDMDAAGTMVVPEMSISPTAGDAGTAYEVSITGLEPESEFTFEVVFDGEAVYTVERMSDADGNFSTTLSTDTEDAPGDYSVVARANATILAEEVLTITGSDVAIEPETQANPSGVSIRVNPASAEPRTLRLVTVTGLEGGKSVILFLFRDGEQVDRFNKTADINGTVVLSVPEVGDESPGTYTLSIVTYGDQDVVLAEADVIVEGDVIEEDTTPEVVQPPTDDLNISVDPPTGAIGTSHTITVEGLSANETVTIDIAVNGSSVYSVQRSANNDGVLVHTVNSESGDPTGTYTVSILRDGTAILDSSFDVTGDDVVQPPTPDQPDDSDFAGAITIDPVSANAGTAHTVTVTGLTPGETVTMDVLFGGSSVFSTDKVADENGEASLILGTEASDTPGEYTVRVLRGDAALTEGVLTVLNADAPPVAQDGVQVVINPPSGAIGTSHAVTISNLVPGETVTLNVILSGEVAFTTDRVADDAGVVTINLIAEEGDPTGIYTVDVLRGGTSIASSDFTVNAATETVVTPPQASGDDSVIADSLNDEVSDTYTFDGTEGDIVNITLESDDFDAYMLLQDDTGFELMFDDDSAGDLNAAIGPYILPYSGEYTVVISSYSGILEDQSVTGDYTLTISNAVLTPIITGQTQTLTFSPDTGSVVLSFEAQVGDVLDITVEGDQAVDTVLTLIDPSGAVAIEDDDGGEGLNPEVQAYTVLTPGTYLIELRSFDNAATGDVDVLVEQRQALQLSATPQQVTVTGKNPVNVVTIQVDAGQRVLMNLAQIDGSSSITLEALQDGVSLMYYSGQAIPDGTRPGFIAPESGIVSILITGDYVGSATIELSVEE